MLLRLLAAAALLLAPAISIAQTAAPAQIQASEPLKARIAALVDIFAGKGDYDAYFAPAFVAQVPKAKFDALNQQIAASVGPVTGIESIKPLTPWSAEITIGFRDGVGSARIAVSETAPNQVTMLLLTGITPRVGSLDDVRTSLRALPGRTGFALARLGDGAPQIIASDNPDQPFGIGSAFKLVILAELVRSVNAGERHWDDKVTIDGRPLPGGTYTLMPKGTQFTLREVAGKMISISDNSATDILLHLVGRKRVEAMLRVVGITHPEGMIPFMGTLDMFKIKGIPGLAPRYLALDAQGRRAMLDGEIAAAPNSAIRADLFKDGRPVMIGALEWFATPSDLVRVMDWLRRNTARGPGAEARAILGINPGLPPAVAGRWKRVAYKGGSEPGVINMTFLLEGKDGSWTVVTASWNNPDAAVEDARFAGLMSKAVELAAPAP